MLRNLLRQGSLPTPTSVAPVAPAPHSSGTQAPPRHSPPAPRPSPPATPPRRSPPATPPHPPPASHPPHLARPSRLEAPTPSLPQASAGCIYSAPSPQCTEHASLNSVSLISSHLISSHLISSHLILIMSDLCKFFPPFILTCFFFEAYNVALLPFIVCVCFCFSFFFSFFRNLQVYKSADDHLIVDFGLLCFIFGFFFLSTWTIKGLTRDVWEAFQFSFSTILVW